MTVLLGVDTGGTYTDAVLVENDETVLASAKSLTTRNDLAQGISASVAMVVERAGIDPASIAMAALSTTLATNALVDPPGILANPPGVPIRWTTRSQTRPNQSCRSPGG